FSAETSWTAHTTLLIDERATVLSALPIIAEKFKPFLATMTSLHLYEFWPTRHILSVQLQSE
ncbi:MAG: 2'-5' RNA ligase, partial [Oscillospiraceae bacterium]|nr:2'-5' RNA ligase [Oscillospiraceae bacterium]